MVLTFEVPGNEHMLQSVSQSILITSKAKENTEADKNMKNEH